MMQFISFLFLVVLAAGCQVEVGDSNSGCETNCDSGDPSPFDRDDGPSGGNDDFIGADPESPNLESKVIGGKEDGHVAVRLDAEGKNLILSMPAPITPGLSAGSGSLGLYGNFEIVSRTDGSSIFQFTLPMSLILRDVDAAPFPETLPNGKPLPGTNLPAFSTDSGGTRIDVYLGNNIATVRATRNEWKGVDQSGQPLNMSHEVPVRNVPTGRTYGTYGSYSGATGGLFLSFRIPNGVAENLSPVASR